MVMDVLNGHGVRARRGYPAEKYIRPESPVATVNIDSMENGNIVVAAEVFAVKAEDCENTADRAVAGLKAAGFTCTVGSCRFHEKMGLFSIVIRVERITKATLPCAVFINEKELAYVKGFSAGSEAEWYRHTSEEGVTEILQETKVWILTLEELIPATAAPVLDSAESFTLEVRREGGVETYPSCRWESVRREETADGVRQVRTAKTWEDRRIS